MKFCCYKLSIFLELTKTTIVWVQMWDVELSSDPKRYQSDTSRSIIQDLSVNKTNMYGTYFRFLHTKASSRLSTERMMEWDELVGTLLAFHGHWILSIFVVPFMLWALLLLLPWMSFHHCRARANACVLL